MAGKNKLKPRRWHTARTKRGYWGDQKKRTIANKERRMRRQADRFGDVAALTYHRRGFCERCK